MLVWNVWIDVLYRINRFLQPLFSYSIIIYVQKYDDGGGDGLNINHGMIKNNTEILVTGA